MTTTKNRLMSIALSFIMAFTVFGVLGTAQVNAAEDDGSISVVMWYGKAGVESMPSYADKDDSLLAEQVLKTYTAEDIAAMDKTDYNPYFFTGKKGSVTIAAAKGVRVESLLEGVVDPGTLIDLKTADLVTDSEKGPFVPNAGQKTYLTTGGVTYIGATSATVTDTTSFVDVPFIIATQRYEQQNGFDGTKTVNDIFQQLMDKEEYLQTGYRSYMGSADKEDLAGNKFCSGVDSIVCYKEATADDVTVECANSVYDGKAKTPAVIKLGDKTLTKDTDYTVKYTNNTNAGTAKAEITGITFDGTVTKEFKITKAKNPMKVTRVNKTYKVKKLKKKAQSYKAIKVSGQKGTVTYAAKAANAKSKKALKFNKKTGKITVAKKTKKGTYKMTITVTAKGDKNYAKSVVKKTVTVKVKK